MSGVAARRRVLLAHPAGVIATGFGSGLSPIMPGTVGSAAALLPWLLMRECSIAVYATIVAVAFGIGVWASAVVVAKLRVEDPGLIVCDEFVGQWIALSPLLIFSGGWPWIVAGFLLFRVFDIAKPWPVSWADRTIKGGFGVMLDDALAGAYAAIVLTIAASNFS